MSQRPTTLGEYIRASRVEHGWTQSELALKMGLGLCGQVTISQVERDQRRPRPESLRKFAAALELDCRRLAKLAAKSYELEVLRQLRGG